MTRKCLRCGDEFAIAHPKQQDCNRCVLEVAAIVVADERRRLPRFPARDLTPVYGR